MKVSLGLLLAVCLAGLQFVAVSVVVFSSFVTSERALLNHARSLLNDVAVNTIEHSLGFLQPARGAAELSRRLAESRVIASDNLALLEKLLFQQLQITPQFAGVFYGDEQGNFVYVKRSNGPGPFRTKIIEREGERRTTDLIWRNDAYTTIRREPDPRDTFDPRVRPWYAQAKAERDNIWTDPYIFFTSKQPGITVASPVFDAEGVLQGVVGVDIEIAAISEFLSRLEIGETGRALIINRNGDVIAHPDRSLISTTNEDGSLRFVSIEEIGDPKAQKAFEGVVRDGEVVHAGDVTRQFELDGARYVSTVRAEISAQLPWTIAVYAPENDFTGGIKANRRQNIWIALAIALSTGLAGVMLARFIYRPVQAFAVRSALISQGEISPEVPAPRTYKELDRVNETLVHEIAERKKSQREYGQTFDLAPRGMAQVAPETGQILRANARFAEVLGYDEDELTALSLADLTHPGEASDVVVLAGEEASDAEDVHEKRFLTKAGATVWVSVHAIMIRDDAGAPLHAVVTIEDLTKFKDKEREIQILNRDMVHTARVNMMGQMATGLAHELNQPLTAITQNMDTARHSLANPKNGYDLAPLLQETEEQAHRAGDIIRSLRDLVRKDEIEKSAFDLTELLEQTLQLIRREARVHGVTVKMTTGDVGQVCASRVQVAQVIINLIRNGIEAISESDATTRVITLSAKRTEVGAIVSVTDTGPGFPPGFEPLGRFETTKTDGMGLGLSICQTIIEAHGGKLWYERSTDTTAFHFSLPQRET